MAFSVEKDPGIRELDLPYDELFRLVAVKALEYTGCPYSCEISLRLTNDEAIKEINKEYRNIDRATDVLSFPMLEFIEPGDFSGMEDMYPDCFDPDTGELILGDIIISTDRVASQAEEYGHSVERAYAFLIAHSMLHLQGFDHERPEDAADMERAQNGILDDLGIRR